MRKRCKSCYQWIAKSDKRSAVLVAIKSPMLKTEIERRVKQELKLGKKTNVRFRKFIDRNLVECKTPYAEQGRIYSLTEKGQKIAKRIAKERGIKWNYSEPDVDWNLFGWIACGRRKISMLLNIAEKRKVRTVKILGRTYTFEAFRDMARSYKYDLLRAFEKKGLIHKYHDGIINIYELTEKGKEIASILKRSYILNSFNNI